MDLEFSVILRVWRSGRSDDNAVNERLPPVAFGHPDNKLSGPSGEDHLSFGGNLPALQQDIAAVPRLG